MHNNLLQYYVKAIFTLQISEACLESCSTSTMELFCENNYRLLTVNYFHKNVSSEMFDWVQNSLCHP